MRSPAAWAARPGGGAVLGVTVALLIVVPVMIAGLIELVRLLLD